MKSQKYGEITNKCTKCYLCVATAKRKEAE